MDDSKVSPKVTAGAAASAATVVLVWLLQVIFGVDVPELVAGAVTVLIGTGAAYLKTDPLRALGARAAGRHEA